MLIIARGLESGNIGRFDGFGVKVRRGRIGGYADVK
jgi:hypothetical protein